MRRKDGGGREVERRGGEWHRTHGVEDGVERGRRAMIREGGDAGVR